MKYTIHKVQDIFGMDRFLVAKECPTKSGVSYSVEWLDEDEAQEACELLNAKTKEKIQSLFGEMFMPGKSDAEKNDWFVREVHKLVYGLSPNTEKGFHCSECNGIDGHRQTCSEFIR